MVTIDQRLKNDKTSQGKRRVNLHSYDVSHPGVQHILQLLEPNVDAFLSSCLESVEESLYRCSGGISKEYHLPKVSSITIVVRSMEGIAYTTGNILDDNHKEIHLSADYVLKLFNKPSASTPTTSKIGSTAPAATPTIAPPNGSTFAQSIPNPRQPDSIHRAAKKEVQGILVHEMVHAMQYNGKGSCPGGLIEGLADWVRLEANLAPPHWKEKPEDLDKKSWDSGYETTAFFLRWAVHRLNEPNLIPRLNEALRSHVWGDGALFHSTFGKTTDELWQEYKKDKRRKS